jgi:hypothetical protein
VSRGEGIGRGGSVKEMSGSRLSVSSDRESLEVSTLISVVVEGVRSNKEDFKINVYDSTLEIMTAAGGRYKT